MIVDRLKSKNIYLGLGLTEKEADEILDIVEEVLIKPYRLNPWDVPACWRAGELMITVGIHPTELKGTLQAILELSRQTNQSLGEMAQLIALVYAKGYLR